MYIDRKQRILVGVLAFVLFLTIGYALFSENITINDDVVTISISDMMRFILLKAKDSNKVIVDYVGEDDPIALMQYDKFTKATYDDPVLILSCNDNGKTLTYYSLKNTISDITKVFDKVLYIPYPTISDNKVSVCKDVQLAVLNHIVGLVLLVYKDAHADSFFNQAKTYMQ
jgi:hypothetical protein